jgi:hypothetical protein
MDLDALESDLPSPEMNAEVKREPGLGWPAA